MLHNKKKKTDLANLLNVSRRTVTNKLQGHNDFQATEMFAIRDNWFPEYSIDYIFAKSEVIKAENDLT